MVKNNGDAVPPLFLLTFLRFMSMKEVEKLGKPTILLRVLSLRRRNHHGQGSILSSVKWPLFSPVGIRDASP